MFRCKDREAIIRWVNMKYMKRGWVPSIVFCEESFYYYLLNRERIPNVTGLSLDLDGFDVTINWTPNENYQTEVQYRESEDEEWTTLSLVEAGVGEV